MRTSARTLAAPLLRWVAVIMLFLPVPAMAYDFSGLLTVVITLPIFALTGVMLGVLLILRRHCWARVAGTLFAIPVLAAGIGVAYVDTWRLWPTAEHHDPDLVAIVVLYALVWMGLLAQTWLLWSWPSPTRKHEKPGAETKICNHQ